MSAVIGCGIAAAVFAWMWACADDAAVRAALGLMAIMFALGSATAGFILA